MGDVLPAVFDKYVGLAAALVVRPPSLASEQKMLEATQTETSNKTGFKFII